MNLIINSKVISILWWILAPLLVAKLLISFTLLFLGQNSFDIQGPKTQNPSYAYGFTKFFDEVEEKPKEQKEKVERFDDLVLKACYIEKDNEFIIVLKDKESLFISLSESYNNAKLVKIEINSATFRKEGKEVVLIIEDKQNKQNTIALPLVPNDVGNDGYISVNRTEFDRYLSDVTQIIKDITIQPLEDEKEFLGIKVNFVRKGSFFDKMNVKKDDIITHIDNKKIKDLSELLSYYENIKNITTLRVGYERDGKSEEIIYEAD